MSSAPGPAERDEPPTGAQPPPPEPRPTSEKLMPAALAALGLLLAAVVLRPGPGLVGGGSGPLGGMFALVVVLAAAWVLGAGTLRHRYRSAVAELYDLPARAERLKTAALVLLSGAIAVVPALLFFANHTEADRQAGDGQYQFTPAPTRPPARTVDAPSVGPQAATGPAQHHGLMALLADTVKVLIAVLVVVTVVLVVRQLSRRKAGARPPAGVRPVEAGGTGLAEAVSSGRRALLGDDARAAVIACYAAMEESLVESGVPRLVADSPTDLLERAVADGAARRADVRVLTALFREARYSSHPMDEVQLRLARAALDAIAEQLAVRTEPLEVR